MRFYDDSIEISTDVWVRLLSDREITRESDLKVLKLVYESRNHEVRASEIAARLNISHHAPLNKQMSQFGKRVIAKTGVQPPLNRSGKPRWWHVPFLGYEKGSNFPWIMRPELVIAFEQVFGQSDSEFEYPGEITIEDNTTLSEGAVSQVFVNRYERSKQARTACIEHHGCRCSVCGFDFGEVYGPIGQNKIHVHHLIPLSEIQQEYKIDPVRDLRPVCPNCHLIIHSKREPFTINEVREQIRSHRSRKDPVNSNIR